MRSTVVSLLAMTLVFGCGGKGGGGDDGSHADASAPAACTADNEGVHGVGLDITPVDALSSLVTSDCQNRLLTSTADVMSAFPNGDAPADVAQTDFTVDRIVLASTNPTMRFAVDDGTRLVVGEEPLCQGAAPWCVAYIIHGTTRNTLQIAACPYLGPDPCMAP
jgi:hypothetical protein